MDFGTYIDRLTALNFRQIAVECLKSNEPILLDANYDQLERGKTSKNEQIGKYENDDYAAEKYMMNPRAGLGNIDLIKEQDFKHGIFFKFTNDSLISDSTGKEKEGGTDLLRDYGDDVLGIFMTSDLKVDLQYDLIRLIKQKIAL